MPDGIPLGFSDAFIGNQSSTSMWNAFVTRNKLEAESLQATVIELRDRLDFLFK